MKTKISKLTMLAIALLVFLPVIFLIVGNAITQYNIYRAKTYLTNAVVNGGGNIFIEEIENYKKEKGAYPSESDLYKIERIAKNNLMKKCGNDKCIQIDYRIVDSTRGYFLDFCSPKEFGVFPCDYSVCVEKGNKSQFNNAVNLGNDWYYMKHSFCL